MRQNDQEMLFAKRIVGPMGLPALAIAVWMSVAAPALAAPPDAEQCSVAVVSKQSVGRQHICDALTIRRLAKQGHVFEQNQLGMSSMLVIGPGYNPAEAAKWFERAAQKGYAPAQVNLAVMYINGWGVAPNYGIGIMLAPTTTLASST